MPSRSRTTPRASAGPQQTLPLFAQPTPDSTVSASTVSASTVSASTVSAMPNPLEAEPSPERVASTPSEAPVFTEETIISSHSPLPTPRPAPPDFPAAAPAPLASPTNPLPPAAGPQQALFAPPAAPAARSSRARPVETVPLPDWSDLPPPLPGVSFGTSSWTYPGWKGLIYSRRYKESGDTTAMLAEYARCPLFHCVGVDSSFYRPPSRATLQSWREVMPPGMEAVGKVWDRITIQRFTLDRKWGDLAGRMNPDFLSPSLCTDLVVGPWLEALGDRAGPLMFEFQAMQSPARPTVEAWADQLEAFFQALPRDGRYAVELRNPELLKAPYLEALSRAGVAHVFNAWTRMPTIGEQLDLPGSFTAPFAVARALLMKGRTYDEAVDRFSPYTQVQEPQEAVRQDLVRLVRRGLRQGTRLYVLVNNRLEGNSPGTIEAVRRMLAKEEGMEMAG